jgi:hypothetical protein
MNCNCNCIAIIQIITYNQSNLRPSFFPSLSTGNTFFNLLNLLRRSSEMFRERNGKTVLPALRVTCVCVRVCVCVRSPVVYMKPSSNFSTCFVVSGKCFAHGMTTPTCQPRESRIYVCPNPERLHLPEISLLRIQTHSVVTHHYSGAVTFLTEGNIRISLHVFVFVLAVEQDIVLIHDAVFFFLHVRAFCVSTLAFGT